MRKSHRSLSLEEWQIIYSMHFKREKEQAIAKRLGRDTHGIKLALKRYPLPWHMQSGATFYDWARYAYECAKEVRAKSHRRERLKCQFIRVYVEDKLKLGWTPEVIAGRLPIDHPGYSTCYESIYEWISNERRDLEQYLHRVGKSRRGKPGARRRSKREPAASKKSIELRPVEATERSELGHYESDQIMGLKGRSAVLDLVCRRTRFVTLRKLTDLKAETVNRTLNSVLAPIPPEARKTLTQDNGPEHALHAELERDVKISVYFCHPYCAPERGTVENRNGIVRRTYPKGTNFDDVSDEELLRLQEKINSTPMKVLGFYTPREVFERELAKLLKKNSATTQPD